MNANAAAPTIIQMPVQRRGLPPYFNLIGENAAASQMKMAACELCDADGGEIIRHFPNIRSSKPLWCWEDATIAAFTVGHLERSSSEMTDLNRDEQTSFMAAVFRGRTRTARNTQARQNKSAAYRPVWALASIGVLFKIPGR
jgi:hypothetical protein